MSRKKKSQKLRLMINQVQKKAEVVKELRPWSEGDISVLKFAKKANLKNILIYFTEFKKYNRKVPEILEKIKEVRTPFIKDLQA